MAHEPEQLTCLESNDDCQGEVEYRMPLSGTGRAFPRCEYHWELRLDRQQKLNEYNSPVAPSWFDESYAGERWDEDY